MRPDGRLFPGLFLLVAASSILFQSFAAQPSFTRINVRWQPEVSSPHRRVLADQYGLTAPVHEGAKQLEGSAAWRTWSYRIVDTSTDNLRRLVQDPAIEDTHGIDRERFRLAGDDRPSRVLLRVLTAALLAFPIAWFASWFGRARTGGIGALVTRGIPPITAEALGVFRVFYAASLFAALQGSRLRIDEAFLHAEGAFAWGWVQWLIGRPEFVTWLEHGILTLLAVFALGLWTRVSYALIVAGMSVWIVVMLQPATVNFHVWEVAFLTMVCLLPVPWGAAFSLDRTIQRWRGRDVSRPMAGAGYGFAVWLPGFVLSAVWASAAYTKIAVSGPEWILGGAVKYHWVIDAHGAPVDWGLWVASHHAAAVLMSFVGVALEASFLVAAFAATAGIRSALAAVLGLPLLFGFYLFHGVVWWPWWIALVSFMLPWQAIADGIVRLVSRASTAADRPTADGARAGHSPVTSRGLQPWHAMIVALVCTLMLAELPEGLGRFTSYSNTYVSTAEFDERQAIDPVHELWIGYGTPAARVVFDGVAPADALVEVMAERAESQPVAPQTAAAIAELADMLERTYGPRHCVTLVRRSRTFDWETGRIVDGADEVIGATALHAGALSACSADTVARRAP